MFYSQINKNISCFGFFIDVKGLTVDFLEVTTLLENDQMRETLRDLINRRTGGPTYISRYLAGRGIHINPAAVSRWSDGVPRKYWKYIVEMTQDNRPVTMDDLRAIHGE